MQAAYPPKSQFHLHALLLAALIFGLASGACQPTVRTPSAPAPVVPWRQVYFTTPGDPANRGYRGGPDAALAEALRAARVSIDLAVMQLNLWSIRDALLDAQRRGLQVRVVTESEYLEEAETQALIAAGIPVLGDRREGLMHDKFAIIDRQEVWSGSMNFTTSDGYKNNNNLLRIRSEELAQNYTAEFDEMFEADRFGPGSPANTPHPKISLGESMVETYFSPDDGAAARLEALIRSAQKSIHFMAFSFTSDDLAQAIIQQAAQGVSVQGVMEEAQVHSNTGSEYDRFISAGLDVRLDGNANNMHHKVMIIDRKIVVTGSYNFTYNAETRNDENLLVIFDRDLAAQFLIEFETIFAQSAVQSIP